jgi:hypothetical protein
MKRLTLTLGVAAMLAAASPALAQVPLAEEAHINDSLRAGRIGDVIRNTCPTISTRAIPATRSRSSSRTRTRRTA